MTVTISTTGEHRHDQSPGQQTGGGLDKDDIVTLSLNFSELPPMFADFLLTDIVTDPILEAQKTNATNYRAAHEDPGAGYFVNVATPQGEVIDDLKFTDSNGDLFDGDVAQYDNSDLHVAGSTDPIYLYSFAGGDILIGSTQAPAGVDLADPDSLDGSKLVFAYYLQENGTHTGADIWGVTFQPLEHPDLQGGTAAHHDDTIDFGDFLHVTASGKLSFDFDTLKSGKFLWVAVGNNDNGLLVTGKDLNVQNLGHAKEGDRVSGGQDPSDSMNTSQGGQGATMGVNDQMFKPGNSAVFTLVKQFNPLDADGPDATGDNVKQIDYGDYINTVGGGIFISQTQGNGTINMTIDLFEAGGSGGDTTDLTMLTEEEGFDYIGAEGPNNDGTSGAFEDDWEVPVATVTVMGAGGPTDVIATWVLAAPGAGELLSGATHNPSGVTVTITGNSIEVTGISALYTVDFTAVDGQTFNRFHVTADAGSEKFDIGRIDVDEGVKITESIGDDVLIHDDGPKVAVDPGVGTIAHNLDETIDADGEDDPDGSDTYANGEAVDNNGDLDDVVNAGMANETIALETAPVAAQAIGKLETAAGEVAALFSVTFNDPVDFGTDGPGDLDGDGRKDTLSLVLSSTELATNLKVTALDGTSLSGLGAAARTIWLVQVDANTIEGRIPGADGVLGTGDDDLVALRITLTTPNNLATATIVSEQFIPIEHGTDDGLYDAEATLLTLSGTLKAKLQVDVEDADDDTATDDAEVTLISSSASYLSIDDDGPAQSVTGGGAKTIADFAMNLDETADDDATPEEGDFDRYAPGEAPGDDNADDDEGDLSAVPTTALIPIGRLATSETGGLAGLFTLAGDDGTDGTGGALAYDFSFVVTDTGDAGIETNITTTATGRKVFLFLEDLDGDGEAEIVGREGTAGGAADDMGAVALRVSIVNPTSADNAQLQAEQFVAFDHDADGGLFDTELVLKTLSSDEKVEVELEVTRTDGDTDEAVGTGTVDLITSTTSPFSYDDDGPAQSVTGGGAKTIADFAMNLDETADDDATPEEGDFDRYAPGEAPGDDNADDDEGDLSAVPTTALIPIGRLATSETGGLAGLFTLAGDDGTDGTGGALAYDFSFVVTDTGDAGIETNITTTATGRKVFLFLEDLDGDGEAEIVGREGTAGGAADDMGAVALRVSIVNPTSADNAQLQAEQFVAFDHDADGGLFDTELVLKTLSSGEKVEVELEVTRTDGDTDEAVGTGTVDLITSTSSPFSYDDDGPVANITDTGEMVVHDESAGEQNSNPGGPESDLVEDNNDNDQAGDPPMPITDFEAAEQADLDLLFENMDADPDNDIILTRIGWAQSPNAVVNSTGTDFGRDDAAATDSEVWSLDVPGADTDSGFDDLNGNDIVLNVENGLVVGRVDGGPNDGMVALVIYLDDMQRLNVAQYIPLGHLPDTGPDQQAIMDDGALIAKLVVTDGDGDKHEVTEPIGDAVKIEDDGATGFALEVEPTQEDDLPEGNDEDGSVNKDSATIPIDAADFAGADSPVTFNLKNIDPNSELPRLLSQGVEVFYVTTLDDASEGGADVIRAYVDYLGVDERVVFTFLLVDNGDGTGDAILRLGDQLDHFPVGDDTEGTLLQGLDMLDMVVAVANIDFTDLLDIRDADTDPVLLPTGFVSYTVEDDVPEIGPVADGLVDFTAAPFAGGFGGNETNTTGPITLNGAVGTDQNDVNDESSEGVKTYTFSSFTVDTSVITDLQGELSADGTRVTYYTDGGDATMLGVFSADDTRWYDIVLGDQGGAGTYTFTVYQDPPAAELNFSFAGFPAGNQIYGVFGAENGAFDLDGPALLVFPDGLVLKGNGTLNSSASTSLNSSKSDGSITALAVSNNSINPNEVIYFGSILDPDPDSIVVDESADSIFAKGSYKNANTLGFMDMNEVNSASLEIAQTTPNGSLVDIMITAYDIDPGVVGNSTTGDENNDFLQDPDAVSANQVNINSVTVIDGNGDVIEFWEDFDGDGTYEIGDGDGDGNDDEDTGPNSVEVTFTQQGLTGIFSATVLNAGDDFTILWTTDGLADLWEVKNVDSNDGFDIGGFNLAAGLPTPDQQFDFTVEMTDYDGDTVTSDPFSVTVDGTGTAPPPVGYDDDMFLL